MKLKIIRKEIFKLESLRIMFFIRLLFARMERWTLEGFLPSPSHTTRSQIDIIFRQRIFVQPIRNAINIFISDKNFELRFDLTINLNFDVSNWVH